MPELSALDLTRGLLVTGPASARHTWRAAAGLEFAEVPATIPGLQSGVVYLVELSDDTDVEYIVEVGRHVRAAGAGMVVLADDEESVPRALAQNLDEIITVA